MKILVEEKLAAVAAEFVADAVDCELIAGSDTKKFAVSSKEDERPAPDGRGRRARRSRAVVGGRTYAYDTVAKRSAAAALALAPRYTVRRAKRGALRGDDAR